MRDFTLQYYKKLLKSLLQQGFSFQTFEDFILRPKNKVVILRHDVDRLPGNALRIAKIEHSMGIKASYFFRVVKQVWNEDIIKEIVSMGHEVGYHYEDLSLCKGNYDLAIAHFELKLKKFRDFYQSKTICMHGSPLLKWDNRKLWEKYNYKNYGIIAEPYFDVDYSKVFYLTDTGRAWNRDEVNIRDTVTSEFNIPVRNTSHLLSLIGKGMLPSQIFINTHPHRWFKPGIGWYKELVAQNLKNIIKRIIIKTG